MIRYMERHKCGFHSIAPKHPMRFVGFIDVVFKAQPEEATGLALRGLVATLQENMCDQKLSIANGTANSVDLTVGRWRVVRSTFSAELNGLADGTQ